MTTRKFGSCCRVLADAMSQPNSSFRVEESGVLCLTIGYVMTERGPGWFDHAVLFCPFCASALQTSEEIRKRSEAR